MSGRIGGKENEVEFVKYIIDRSCTPVPVSWVCESCVVETDVCAKGWCCFGNVIYTGADSTYPG